MKFLQLTNGTYVVVDDEDFNRLNQFKWYASRTTIKRQKRIDGELVIIPFANEVMQVGYGIMFDHKDRNFRNNQKNNLREASIIQNQHNTVKQKYCSSKYKGVHWDEGRKKWHVAIRINRIKTFLGRFNSEEEAGKAYDKVAIEYQKEFAVLNFPTSL